MKERRRQPIVLLLATGIMSLTLGEAFSQGWSADFAVVQIPATIDGSRQPAYFLAAKSGDAKPLLVSLHTWSGDYKQADTLAQKALEQGWNYIHPDFRGANRRRGACLSEAALSDIDEAIQYAFDHGAVDREKVFVVGVSGGGYATLGVYLRTRHRIKAFLSWAAISDLSDWYWQSKNRDAKYAGDIEACTAAPGTFDEQEARRRSPLHWQVPAVPKGRLEIYAGINDGYTGSVPISHSILFFNKLVQHFGDSAMAVPDRDMVPLLTRRVVPRLGLGRIQDRAVLYFRETPDVSLTIFAGGHEMLADYCFDRIKKMAEGVD